MAGGGGAGARAYAAGGLTSQPILARMDTLRAEILREYDSRESAINPFIGRAFEDAEAGALRVMTIGINAYLNSADWPNQKPGWFAAWFDEGKNPFDRAVARDASTVASSLVSDSRLFAGLAFRGKASIFHTNAIKTYLPEAIGKRSDQISPQRYVGHRATWHAEFEIMARHGVLPHVVIVFGRPFWAWAWQAFHRQYRPHRQVARQPLRRMGDEGSDRCLDVGGAHPCSAWIAAARQLSSSAGHCSALGWGAPRDDGPRPA